MTPDLLEEVGVMVARVDMYSRYLRCGEHSHAINAPRAACCASRLMSRVCRGLAAKHVGHRIVSQCQIAHKLVGNGGALIRTHLLGDGERISLIETGGVVHWGLLGKVRNLKQRWLGMLACRQCRREGERLVSWHLCKGHTFNWSGRTGG